MTLVFFHQLNVVAYDSAYPEVRTTAEVMIGVTRNQNGPQFQPSATYEKVIVDSYAVGEIVLTVRATDGDSQVRTDSISLLVSWRLSFQLCLSSHFDSQ